MKKITLKHLYLHYPHKTYDIHSNTVPVPYFPKKEISGHRWKLTYKDWKRIMGVYLKNLTKLLLSGKRTGIPSGLGDFQLRKYKPVHRRINFKATKEKYGEVNKSLPKGKKKIIYHNNRHTQGYCPIFQWYRFNKRFAHKWTWRFKPSRLFMAEVSDRLIKKPHYINQLNEVVHNKRYNETEYLE